MIPREWQKKTSKKGIFASKIEARIDMSERVAGKGLCPECKQPMNEVIVNGMTCLCCMQDRIVLPKRNEKEVTEISIA